MSVALEECPFCPPAAPAGEKAAAAPPVPAAPAAKPAPSPAAAAPPAPAPPRAAAAVQKEESALWRGFRWGVGFMLAVVTLLLLIVLLLLWLSGRPGWKEGVEQLSR